MEHRMNLRPEPFDMINSGKKTIELRLYDEKRQQIQVGDTITFTNTETAEELTAMVKDLFVFDSFGELYKKLPLLACGYTEDDIDTAKPEDMLDYYPLEMQKRYGVVGIEVEWIH